ncbi:MAG: twin-arginine translocase TatA/TatE family subunit [Bacteroidota bacterium]|nr:twin-arginine translocase TatA/TatE family subunit [Bacteroidota bacterium]
MILIILGMIGITEILIIAGILLLLFGGRKIPQLMRGIGEGIGEFKKARNTDDITTDDKTGKEKDTPRV